MRLGARADACAMFAACLHVRPTLFAISALLFLCMSGEALKRPDCRGRRRLH